MIMAHRGASAHAPENTVPAFRMAMDQGVDGLELDVHLTRDGVAVVIHDETTDRTGTRQGRIIDQTLADLEQDDFGVKCGIRFSGTRIPTLQAVLHLLDRWSGCLNIELKTNVLEYPGIEETVLKLVAASGAKDRVIISSFHQATLARCRAADPDIELAVLLPRGREPDLAALRALGAGAIHPDARDIRPARVKQLHRAGFKVRPYTVDSRLFLLWLAFCGVDAVITNKPLESAAFLRFWCRK